MNYFIRKKINKLNKKLSQMAKAREERQAEGSQQEDHTKEILVYRELAFVYDKLRYNKKFPYAEYYSDECLRACAKLGDKDAQYHLARRKFDLGVFWLDLYRTFFSSKVHQVYYEQAFKEALGFAQMAEDQGHALAKRWRGLAYINGWGVEADKNKGFELVVQSIDQENAWDRVTKIFEEIGLNKPEFFSMMMQMRKPK